MKNYLLLIALLLTSTYSFAQKEKELKLNKETNMIEATYYHDNGEVSQEGTFNLDRKLHGEWVSYDRDGEKISTGSYNNGVKTGKWMFWNNGVVKEVMFDDNVVAGVINKKSVTPEPN